MGRFYVPPHLSISMKTCTRTAEPCRLGVTGGAGSGKSAVCDVLAGKGLAVVSSDELARRAVLAGSPALARITDYFGTGVLKPDGSLDRKRLRLLIINDPEKRRALEQFVHPEIFRLMAEACKAARERLEPAIVVEVPLLFEQGMASAFDYVLTVSADPEIRIRRLMHRDGTTREEAEALINIQLPEAVKIEKADFVIYNNGTPEQTRHLVEAFYHDFMDRVKKSERG